jgi:hypothetical protein
MDVPDPTDVTPEQLEGRYRESNPLWVWGDVYYENDALLREMFNDPGTSEGEGEVDCSIEG